MTDDRADNFRHRSGHLQKETDVLLADVWQGE